MPFDLVQSRLPKGFAWSIAPDSQLSDIVEVIESDVFMLLLQRAADCGTIRNPDTCVDFNGLGAELGLEPFDSMQGNLEQYRNYLAAVYYTPYRTGSDSDLQKVLDTAGYNEAVVIKNNNLQNPKLFMELVPQMVAGQDDAVAGHTQAFAGMYGYEVLVNGKLYNSNKDPVSYPIGDNSNWWAFVDFIGGEVVKDGSGNILSIAPLQVLKSEEEKFKSLILRTKPMSNWIVLVVEYVDAGVIAQTGYPEEDTIAQTGAPEDDIIAEMGV